MSLCETQKKKKNQVLLTWLLLFQDHFRPNNIKSTQVGQDNTTVKWGEAIARKLRLTLSAL